MTPSLRIRNRQLVNIARRLLAQEQARGNNLSFSELVDMVLATRPSGHFVEYDRASRMMRALATGRNVLLTPTSRAQYAEIADQVAEARRQNSRMNYSRALSFVLQFKRPSRFYIEPDTLKRILRPYFEMRLVARM